MEILGTRRLGTKSTQSLTDPQLANRPLESRHTEVRDGLVVGSSKFLICESEFALNSLAITGVASSNWTNIPKASANPSAMSALNIRRQPDLKVRSVFSIIIELL
jgi:hypothetical protein